MIMKLKDVYAKAKEVGLKNTHKTNKTTIIKAIQIKEGNNPCFLSKNECDQNGCLWRKDCIDNFGRKLKRFKFWMN